MPSFELEPFTPYPAIRIVVATEFILPATIKLLFWTIDPEQQIAWPTAKTILANVDPAFEMPQSNNLGYERQHFLWQHTCFEVFVGIKDQTVYREINLSPSTYWNCYAFDDYRKPDSIPPQQADDIQLTSISLENNKLHATLDLQQFISEQDCYLQDLKIGVTSVVKLRNQRELFYALQHSALKADFHQKRDWTFSI